MQKSKEMLFQKRQLVLLASFLSTSSAFVSPLQSHGVIPKAFVPASRNTVESSSALNLFGKMFEEEGPLGKGITVGKVQVALQAKDRGPTSIFGMLEESSNEGGDSPYELAQFGNEVCLALLRKSDEWTAACSSSEWFSENDAGKAERTFNDLANKEAMKFEKVSCRIVFFESLMNICDGDVCSFFIDIYVSIVIHVLLRIRNTSHHQEVKKRVAGLLP